MKNLKDTIRDFWRGFTEADEAAMRAKMDKEHQPGDVIPMTSGELKALLAAFVEESRP